MFKSKTLSVKETRPLSGKDAKALRKKVADQFPQLNGEKGKVGAGGEEGERVWARRVVRLPGGGGDRLICAK